MIPLKVEQQEPPLALQPMNITVSQKYFPSKCKLQGEVSEIIYAERSPGLTGNKVAEALDHSFLNQVFEKQKGERKQSWLHP